MSSETVMTIAYPEPNLAFDRFGTMLVLGQAYRVGTSLRSMPRTMSLQIIDSNNNLVGEKSFASNTIGMSIVSGYFTASFNLQKDLLRSTNEALRLKVVCEFRDDQGDFFTKQIEQSLILTKPPKDPTIAEHPYESWFPTLANDGGIGMEWLHPLTNEVLQGQPFPVHVSTKKQPRLDYPVLELLDNRNRSVVSSAWVNQKGWNIHTPMIRAMVDAPSDLNIQNNTHHLRLGIFDIELNSRVATSYYSLRVANGINVAKRSDAMFKRTNLNRATAKMMAENIPGIGPSKAKLIVQNRPINQIEDLLALSGFSAMSIETIRNHVDV